MSEEVQVQLTLENPFLGSYAANVEVEQYTKLVTFVPRAAATDFITKKLQRIFFKKFFDGKVTVAGHDFSQVCFACLNLAKLAFSQVYLFF